MAKNDQVLAINNAVYKLQLAMLEGITDQKQLFEAENLMTRYDYEDVVTERNIAKLCGFPLCQTFLTSDVSKRGGKPRISLIENKCYDLKETRKYCSSGCLINSKAFAEKLRFDRPKKFDSVKLNEILKLFGYLDVKDSSNLNEELGFKLMIKENFEVRSGESSLEQWMGPSNAVEGYVPSNRSESKSRNFKDGDSKVTQSNQEKNEDPPSNEMNFTSTIIIPDEFSISKSSPETKQAPPVRESNNGERKIVPKEQTEIPPKKQISRFRRDKEKEKKIFGVDGMGCVSSVTNDGYSGEYSVSKQPTCSAEDTMADPLKNDLKALDEKSSPTGSSSASKKNSLRLPSQAKQASHSGESEDGKAEKVMTDLGQIPVLPRKKLSFYEDHEMEKYIKNSGVDEIGLESSAIMGDGSGVEYSVSKQHQCSVEDSLSCNLKGGLQTLDGNYTLSGSSSGSNAKGSRTEPEKSGKRVISVEYHADSCEDGEEILAANSYERLEAQDVCSSSETVTKSCLKTSGSKKLSRSVTWADQNDGCGDLCEVKNNDITAGPSLCSNGREDVDSLSRLALAEACARALSQAAEAVSSRDLDASDATAEAGIVLLPSTHQLDEEITEEHIEEEMVEEEPTLLKWPNKPGISDSVLFDRDQSWLDEPPEGFNLTLSSFAMMWDSLFCWVSSSSLAYIYGKEESAHEEFLLVNGMEYPRRIILQGGLSLEIKKTIAECLSRASPSVAACLNLPIAISDLESGMWSLLETMSLQGAVPAFGFKEWQVIVLLLLDALSVSRIPRIAPYLSNKYKVLEGSGIGNEEYETMKDILLPLGRVPQFAPGSGA